MWLTLSGFVVKNLSPKDKSFLGLSMVPRGEIGLIFAELGKVAGVLNDEVHSILIFIVVITTLLPPIILKILHLQNTK